MDIPKKCCICGVKPNLRDWKRGLERWAYEPYRRGQQPCNRWFCEKHLDADLGRLEELSTQGKEVQS